MGGTRPCKSMWQFVDCAKLRFTNIWFLYCSLVAPTTISHITVLLITRWCRLMLQCLDCASMRFNRNLFLYRTLLALARTFALMVPRNITILRFFCDIVIPTCILPRGVKVSEDVIITPNGRLVLEWVLPTRVAGATPNAFADIVLYLHGGAYVIGKPGTLRPGTFPFANAVNAAICVPDFRRPPEHSVRECVEDALSAYKYLLNQFPAAKISLAGESAGGGLAASLLSTLDKLSMPMPRCAALMSPWTDLSNSGLHHVDVSSYTGCDYLPPQVVQWFSKRACGRLPENQLPASPMYAEGSFEHFPPICVQWGADEILAEQITHFCDVWSQKGADITRLCVEGGVHVPTFFSFCHEASKKSLLDLADFLKKSHD